MAKEFYLIFVQHFMARYARRASTSRRTSRRKTGSFAGVWLLIGIFLGVAMMGIAYIYYPPTQARTFASGKEQKIAQSKVKNQNSNKARRHVKEEAGERFEFYTLLPGMEVELPDVQATGTSVASSQPTSIAKNIHEPNVTPTKPNATPLTDNKQHTSFANQVSSIDPASSIPNTKNNTTTNRNGNVTGNLIKDTITGTTTKENTKKGTTTKQAKLKNDKTKPPKPTFTASENKKMASLKKQTESKKSSGFSESKKLVEGKLSKTNAKVTVINKALAPSTTANALASNNAQKINTHMQYPNVVTDNIPKSTAHYIIQAGIFKGLHEADNLKRQLSLRGFSPKIQKVQKQANNPLFRVTLGPFASESQAQGQKKRLEIQNIRGILILQRPKI